MKKKIRLDLSQEDLHHLILIIPGEQDNQGVRNILTQKLVDKVDLKGFTEDLRFTDANGLMAFIVHTIFLLTGVPESKITPSSKLTALFITDLKKEQLRVFTNKYIKQQGSLKFITPNEMAATATVKDVFDFANKKLS